MADDDSAALLQRVQEEIAAVEAELVCVKEELQAALNKLAKTEAYNEDLRLQSERLSEELHSFRQAAVRDRVDAAVQTDPVSFVTDIVGHGVIHNDVGTCASAADMPDGATQETISDALADTESQNESTEPPMPDWTVSQAGSGVQDAAEPMSIADSLKEAAEEAMHESGVVFDDHSGMYYDYNSGYYYDAERALYYEPSTGIYYSYDEETQSHVIHSRVDLTQYSNHGDQESHNLQTTGGRSPAGDSDQRERRKKKRSKDKYNEQEESKSDRKHKKRKKDSKETSSSRKKKKRKLDKEASSKHNGQDSKHDRHRKKSRERDDSKKKKLKKKKEKRSKYAERSSDVESKEAESKAEEKAIKECDPTDEKEKLAGKIPEASIDACLLPSDGSTRHSPEGGSTRHSPEEGSRESVNQNPDSEVGEVPKVDEVVSKNIQKEEEVKEEEQEGEEGVYTDSSESELEEGELSESESESSRSSSEASAESSDDPVEVVEETNARYFPPCIRSMVTQSDCLDVGTLFLVTVTGASIGREKNLGHVIEIPDLQISKMHADIRYNEELRKYVLKDHASQNGTFLNGKRLAEAKVMSEPHPLSHLDKVQLGGTILELHVHPGTDTCDGCEPGQVQAQLKAEIKPEIEAPVLTKAEKEKRRRQALKMIKCKYGLKNMDYEGNKATLSNPKYEDKASSRRKTVGSDNPYQKDDAPASVDRAISEDNKGHKLLQKMGWKEGESLGKSMAGLQEPIKINIRTNQLAGLGSDRGHAVSMDDVEGAAASEKWVKAQKRFDQIDTASHTESKDKPWVQGPSQYPQEG